MLGYKRNCQAQGMKTWVHQAAKWMPGHGRMWWDLTEEKEAQHPLQHTHCLYKLLPLGFFFSHSWNLKATILLLSCDSFNYSPGNLYFNASALPDFTHRGICNRWSWPDCIRKPSLRLESSFWEGRHRLKILQACSSWSNDLLVRTLKGKLKLIT